MAFLKQNSSIIVDNLKYKFVVVIAGQVDIHYCSVALTGVISLGGPGSPRWGTGCPQQ